MAKPLLLFVHGSGKYDANWSDKHRAKLAEIAATYPKIAERGTLEAQVKIVPINYDTVFRDLLDRWRAQDDQLTEFLTESGLSLPGAIQFLNEQEQWFSHYVISIPKNVEDAVEGPGLPYRSPCPRGRSVLWY